MDYVRTDAVLSDDGAYRYMLMRIWNPCLPAIVFIGLNPSTADASLDDPTIRRCVGFADDDGCGALIMLNLFAYRSTNPAELLKVADPVGFGNNSMLIEYSCKPYVRRVVAAWGSHKRAQGRGLEVYGLLAGRDMYCLGITKDGSPKHPLYVRADQPFLLWKPV